MQPINAERERAHGRFRRQLPASVVTQTTPSIHIDSNSVSNSIDRLTNRNKKRSQSKHFETISDDLETHRSLSSIPTYSSLSRHTPETRDCATQIITLPRRKFAEDDQELSDDSLSLIDSNRVLFVNNIDSEDTDLMPISNGFTSERIRTSKSLAQSQIVSRAPKFREKVAGPYNSTSKLNSKATNKNPPQRPTAVKQPIPQPDTYMSSTKRNGTTTQLPKGNSTNNGPRRLPTKPSSENNPSKPQDRKRSESINNNGVRRYNESFASSPVNQSELGRIPVRFNNQNNNNNHYHSPPSPPPAKNRNSTPPPPPRNASQRPRRMNIGDSEYVIERRRQPVDYINDDYRADDRAERVRPKRVVRVERDDPYPDDEYEEYYVEPIRSSRPRVVRRETPTEYVYVDERPEPPRYRRIRRPKVVYVDDSRRTDREDDYIYVDEDGNEVEFVEERVSSPHYAEYVYDDVNYRRRDDRQRSNRSQVIYVDDELPPERIRYERRSRNPSSTRVVYE